MEEGIEWKKRKNEEEKKLNFQNRFSSHTAYEKLRIFDARNDW